jgi:hypothetical protein
MFHAMPGNGVARSRISRRQFLTGSAALSLGAVLLGHDDQIDHLLAELGGTPAGANTPASSTPPTLTHSFTVERDSDLALLDFNFYGFTQALTNNGVLTETVNSDGTTTQSGGERYTVLYPNADSPTGVINNVITVQFPPQCIGEAAYHYESTEAFWDVDPPPVLSKMAGPSRLCFTLPANGGVVFETMTADDLLDWSDWILLVPDTAEVTHTGGQLYPSEKRQATTDDPTTTGMLTYIEYPYALYLAPTVYKGATGSGYATNFTSRKAPLKSPRHFYDPWTAAVAQTNPDGSSRTAQGTAIWARDMTGTNQTLEEYLDFNDPGHSNP